MKTLILASSSVYRRELLEKLQIPFTVIPPDVDESALSGETAEQTALRLAQEKARKIGGQNAGSLVIGSDQVAILDGLQLGKPYTFDNAFAQLQAMKGKTVLFHTALCLYNADDDRMQARVIETAVSFRHYSDAQIDNYLRKEQPYHCAGSAKSEGLGIALISAVRGEDPNALIGLPLIALIDMLQNENMRVI